VNTRLRQDDATEATSHADSEPEAETDDKNSEGSEDPLLVSRLKG
jgi:hypothetical protein